MSLDDIIVFHNSRKINQFEPISSQCKNNDVLLLRKIFAYQVVWKGQGYQFRYLTNTLYSKFILRLLNNFKIPQEEHSKYVLQIGTQLIDASFLFPLEGISEDIHLLESQGIRLGKHRV